MAKTTFKNTAPGPRGVYGPGGLVMIESGSSVEIDVDAQELKDAKASGYFEFGGKADDPSAEERMVLGEAGQGDPPKPEGPPVNEGGAPDAEEEAVSDEPLSSLKRADLIDIAKAEDVDVETDDNRADLIRKIEKARA